MNKVVISGRLTKDVDLRSTGSNNIAKFTVAVDRTVRRDDKWEHEADFISCIAFGNKANFVNKYFGKGSGILVQGNIHTGSYEKDGHKVYTTDIICDDIEFFGNKTEEGKEAPKSGSQGFMDIPDDVADIGLPFN